VPDGTDEGVKIRTGEGWRPSVSHLPAVSPSDLSGGPRLRVLLVDDHKVVCEGLAAVLSREEDVEVVGCAAEGRQAVDLALELRPDVVLMDVSMPGMNGDEAARQIKTHVPQTRVVAFSMYDEPEKRKRMYQAGAEDYVLKSAESEELLAAIRGRASA
jgi:DNA-binding NarL/FixJ family response regulator